MAFIFTDQLEYAGNVQVFLRWLFDWETKDQYYFPDIRSLGGAIACLTLVLYPYVYLMSRSGFRNVTKSMWETAVMNGKTPRQIFFQIALPLARPHIIVGITIVLMETLSDFGTVSYFAVQALARGVYDVWINMDSLVGASQLSIIMVSFIGLLLWLEHKSRCKSIIYQKNSMPFTPLSITGRKLAFAISFCSVICLIGFIIPAGILIGYSLTYYEVSWSNKLITHTYNSLSISLITALFTVCIATVLAYNIRINPQNDLLKKLTILASSGYGIPGTVLGIGILVPLSTFDNSINTFFENTFGINTGLLLTGSLLGLVYAYSVRFMAIGYGGVSSSLKTISPNMDGAARTLGKNPKMVFWLIHLPLIRNGALISTILIFCRLHERTVDYHGA